MAIVDNPTNLLVPIHLDALVVNNNIDPLWKDTSMALKNLADYTFCRGLGYYLEKKATEGPDDDATGEIMPKGMHLHWILPDALRKGKIKNNESAITFPAAPNRWLIVRMDEDQQFRSWVLESDHLNSDEEARLNWINNPTVKVGGKEVTALEAIAIGNVVPLADWTEPGKGEVDLTVVAPGNPDFAASYMTCRNVFGFYDDMKTDKGGYIAEGTRLTYQVYGWYADGEHTLLEGVDKIEQLAGRLKELGWVIKDADTLTVVPDNIVFHAMSQSVLWSSKPDSNIPSTSTIDIGIGNTTSEALASLLSRKTTTSQSEIPNKLLAAYQFKSLLDKGIEGNGLNLLKKQMHARSFSPVDGGVYFAIEPAEKETADMRTDKDTSNLPFPVEVADCLDALNYLQHEYDADFNKLTSLQALLFALRYKKAFGRSRDGQSETFPTQEWERIQKEIDTATVNARSQIEALIPKLDAARKKNTARTC